MIENEELRFDYEAEGAKGKLTVCSVSREGDMVIVEAGNIGCYTVNGPGKAAMRALMEQCFLQMREAL